MNRMVATAFSVILSASCAVAAPAPSDEGDAGAVASWPHHPTIDALVSASPVIVRAVVVENLGERLITGAPTQRFPVALTEFKLRVERVLKGSPGSQIVVIEPGRAGDPANTYKELPLMRQGSRVLLFLYPSAEPALADGTVKYGIVSPEGLYEVVGARVTTRSEQPAIRIAAGQGLDLFERAVVAAAQAR